MDRVGKTYLAIDSNVYDVLDNFGFNKIASAEIEDCLASIEDADIEGGIHIKVTQETAQIYEECYAKIINTTAKNIIEATSNNESDIDTRLGWIKKNKTYLMGVGMNMKYKDPILQIPTSIDRIGEFADEMRSYRENLCIEGEDPAVSKKYIINMFKIAHQLTCNPNHKFRNVSYKLHDNTEQKKNMEWREIPIYDKDYHLRSDRDERGTDLCVFSERQTLLGELVEVFSKVRYNR